MPDPTTAPTGRTSKPTAKQLRYLKALAEQRGQSFTYPQGAFGITRGLAR